MSTINDGGPAYPVNEKTTDGTHWHTHLGKSLRDDFAGQMMAALIAEPEWAGAPNAAVKVLTADLQKEAPDTPLQNLYAVAAVKLTDALIAELQRVPA
jgi:hypothetical protein